jgi:hypothetical protein
LTELNELVYLDISDDKEDSHLYDILTPGARFKVSALLQRHDSLPKLHSFDISGEARRTFNIEQGLISSLKLCLWDVGIFFRKLKCTIIMYRYV